MDVFYMDAMIITRPKRCSKPGHAPWTLPHGSMRAAQGIFRRQRGRCKPAGWLTPMEKKMKDVILIDAGTGNLRSVQKALECVGANVERTDDAQKVLSAKRVVLPGVGAFGDFMTGLRIRGLEDAIQQAAQRGIPLLGICVGMQALFEVGHEMGQYQGLGLLNGDVTRFAESLSVKVPHTGWNQ